MTGRHSPGGGYPGGWASLLFVGTFRLEKGLPTLVEAMRHLKEQGDRPVTLHLVGDGRLEATLREAARVGGIEEWVRFEGYQPPEKVATWMAAARRALPAEPDRRVSERGSRNARHRPARGRLARRRGPRS